MPEDRIILTKAGYARLQRELDTLLGEESQEVAELLADVHEDEAGEEATFYEALMTKERLDERIAYLRSILARAEVLEDDPDPDAVSPGNRVTVWDYEYEEEVVFDLYSSAEIAHAGRQGVSLSSPVGKALLGKKVGDVVEVKVPDGVARYKIRKIEPIPDDQ